MVYLLSKHSSFLSLVIAKSSIVHQLFSMTSSSSAELLEQLANLCVFVLAVYRDLKSTLLLQACARNYTVAALCLLDLSASVNTGVATDTPIAHACKHQNVALVRSLLAKDVSDVTVAMKIAISLRNNGIIAMLLHHVHQRGQSGVVNCSHMDLPDLQTEWLLPLFTGKYRIDNPAPKVKS